VGLNETYKEGVFVGYRWFDAHALAPAYPFGFGLSYTHFRYSGLQVTHSRVSFTITDAGSRPGSAAPQLYLGLSALPGVPEPPAQLAGFTKIALAAGQHVRVSFALGPRALSYWDAGSSSWRIAAGCDRVLVGSSSRDVQLRGVLPVGGAVCVLPR
jgi:beta-glucosidase